LDGPSAGSAPTTSAATAQKDEQLNFTHLPTGLQSADAQNPLQDKLRVQRDAAKVGSAHACTSYESAQQQVIAAAASFMQSLALIQPAAVIPERPPGAPSLPSSAAGAMQQQQQQQQQQQPLPRQTHLVSTVDPDVRHPNPDGGNQQHVQAALHTSIAPISGMQDLAAALIAAVAAASVVFNDTPAAGTSAPDAADAPVGEMQPIHTALQEANQQLPYSSSLHSNNNSYLPAISAGCKPSGCKDRCQNATMSRLHGNKLFEAPEREAGLTASAASNAALLPDDVLQFLSGQGREDVDSVGLVRIALGLRPLKDKKSSLSGGAGGPQRLRHLLVPKQQQ